MRLRFALLLSGTSLLLAATAAAQPAPPPPSATAPGMPLPGQPLPPPGQPLPPNPGQPLPPNPGQPLPPNPGQPLPPNPGQPLPPNPGQPLPPNPGQPPGVGQPPGPMFPPQGNPPPNGGWQPPPWQGGPPQGTAPVPAPAEPPGISHGLPLARRGQIAVEAAGFTDLSGQDSLLALGLNAHVPVGSTSFVDARLPMASYFPGNIMLGASHVFRFDPRGFFSVGAQVGLPLVTQFALRAFSLPNGTWNMHEYQANFMPIKVALGYERLMGQSFTFRLDVEPVLSFPIGDHGDDVGFTFQHAVEIQYGHSIGVGLRLQGVAATESLIDDAYQLSVEPFLVVQRELGFARLGLLMPIDDSVAGPAFDQAWGLRLWTGLHID